MTFSTSFVCLRGHSRFRAAASCAEGQRMLMGHLAPSDPARLSVENKIELTEAEMQFLFNVANGPKLGLPVILVIDRYN